MTPAQTFRTMSLMLFDTCSHKCSYCHFAETGKVLDARQLAPYRNLAFIKRVTKFFIHRSTGHKKWLFLMTGGEPLLMPNFEAFCEPLIANGDRISLNTALLIGEDTAAFRYLVSVAAGTEYLFASLHPESELEEDAFFRKVKVLKDACHRVMVRYICHPQRLRNLQHIQDRCREIDVCFCPTAMFSPVYPQAYTAHERALIESYVSSLGQIIGQEGGLDTTRTKCWAGSKYYHADVRTGIITPCGTVAQVVGNIYEDWLDEYDTPISCPSAGKTACSCNAYFQQDIVIGAEDSKYFAAQKRGFVEPIPADRLRAEILRTNSYGSQYGYNMGQVETSSQLILGKRQVKEIYTKNKSYLQGPYADGFHPDFRGLMDRPAVDSHTAKKTSAVTSKRTPAGMIGRWMAKVRYIITHPSAAL